MLILDDFTKKAVLNATLSIEGISGSTISASNGVAELVVNMTGERVLHISAPDYLENRIPIFLEGKTLDLGTIYLSRDITLEKTENLISLTEADFSEDENPAYVLGLLQATKDVFLNRAAFDFGQAFFRVRGYGSERGKVFINGIPMNKFLNGRPQWNNWGGLNDVTRNQEFSHGLGVSDFGFGGILGTTNIDTRPSGFRPGFRFSASAANRSYAGRLMATYNSGVDQNGFSYSFSGSRRWAKQGYMEGTLYDAYSFFGAAEYRFNAKNSIALTTIFASNRRGRSSAITEEVFDLVGRKYNPYWGLQNGDARNSRERKIQEPMAMLNYYYKSKKFRLNTGVAYQTGINARSRLGYFNAPNPDPTYYRNLPSFYVNSPIGANFVSANLSREGFLGNPQINWTNVYDANLLAQDKKAAYILYADTTKDSQLSLNSTANLTIGNMLKIDFGVNYRALTSENYAKINDLLGAEFHEDIDPFSNTRNDVNGDVLKSDDAIFGYNYTMNANEMGIFTQIDIKHKKWSGFLSGVYNQASYQREGLFQNERFLEDSLGKGEAISFSNYGLKTGGTYKFNGRHWVGVEAAYLTKPPVMQHTYINPRENGQIVPEVRSETITSADINYFIRLPKLRGRITGFYTQFQDLTDVNFFFVESGVGSDFVQEVITNLKTLHWGSEVGLEYQLSSSVKLSAVAAVGKYTYANNPDISINFDTAGSEEDLINVEGTLNLGTAKIKNYKLAQGPQQAYALGVSYRDPKYWWVAATANYLTDNYANIATITRTDSFLLDPDTGEFFPNATEENVNRLLAQKPMEDFYLLNVIGGKSWLIKDKYISVFASVNNVFDTVFKTGGYEQSRNGNFGELSQDVLSGQPSFGTKYWYGFGRTYFLNVAISF